MSRPTLYLPLDFTVAKGVQVDFDNCKLFKYDFREVETVNSFVKHFDKDAVYNGWDIYAEEPILLLDRIESYESGELIVI